MPLEAKILVAILHIEKKAAVTLNSLEIYDNTEIGPGADVPADSTTMRQSCPRSADSSSGSVQICSPGETEFYDAVVTVDDLLTNHFEPPVEIEINDFNCPQSKYAIQPPADNHEERMVTLNFLVRYKRFLFNPETHPEIGDVKGGEEMFL